MVIVENGTMLHIETSRHLATARLIMNYVLYYVIVGDTVPNEMRPPWRRSTRG
jgi:hypothetical protein